MSYADSHPESAAQWKATQQALAKVHAAHDQSHAETAKFQVNHWNHQADQAQQRADAHAPLIQSAQKLPTNYAGDSRQVGLNAKADTSWLSRLQGWQHRDQQEANGLRARAMSRAMPSNGAPINYNSMHSVGQQVPGYYRRLMGGRPNVRYSTQGY